MKGKVKEMKLNQADGFEIQLQEKLFNALKLFYEDMEVDGMGLSVDCAPAGDYIRVCITYSISDGMPQILRFLAKTDNVDFIAGQFYQYLADEEDWQWR